MSKTMMRALMLMLLMSLLMEGDTCMSKTSSVQSNSSSTISLQPSSPWLQKLNNLNPRLTGCRRRPWICWQGEFPPRSLCCRNRCVSVTSDRNNCGFCGVRCPFAWQCCGGICVDTNFDPFNCGRCGHMCQPIGILCIYGMCGYAQDRPCPSWLPPQPWPPKVPKPSKPCPPFPPQHLP